MVTAVTQLIESGWQSNTKRGAAQRTGDSRDSDFCLLGQLLHIIIVALHCFAAPCRNVLNVLFMFLWFFFLFFFRLLFGKKKKGFVFSSFFRSLLLFQSIPMKQKSIFSHCLRTLSCLWHHMGLFWSTLLTSLESERSRGWSFLPGGGAHYHSGDTCHCQKNNLGPLRLSCSNTGRHKVIWIQHKNIINATNYYYIFFPSPKAHVCVMLLFCLLQRWQITLCSECQNVSCWH